MCAETNLSAITLTNIWKAGKYLIFLFINNTGTGNSKPQPAGCLSQLSGEVGSDFTRVKTPGSESADTEGRDGRWVVNQGGEREACI